MLTKELRLRGLAEYIRVPRPTLCELEAVFTIAITNQDFESLRPAMPHLQTIEQVREAAYNTLELVTELLNSQSNPQ